MFIFPVFFPCTRKSKLDKRTRPEFRNSPLFPRDVDTYGAAGTVDVGFYHRRKVLQDQFHRRTARVDVPETQNLSVNFQFRNRENGRDSQFVFALQQVADRRQERGAEVKIPDRRPQTQDGEEVDQDRLVVQGHGVIHG